jgi:hypothetical protein
MVRQNRARIYLIACLVPIAAWASVVAITYLAAALSSHGTDTFVWLSLGGASAIAVAMCIYALLRFRTPTTWRSVLVALFAALLTTPGTVLLLAFARNPP